MKIAIWQVLTLSAVVGLAVAIGYRPTAERFGAAGVTALWAAAVICWIGAVVSAVPLLVAAKLAPTYVGQIAFAGTAIRLLVTGALAVGYQVWTEVHMRSFLLWLVVFYLSLLAVETGFGVVLVRRHYRPAGLGATGGSGTPTGPGVR